MVSSLLGSLRPILLKEYMRMLYTEAGCRSTMFAWLMVGEMFRVDCLKSQESGRGGKGQSAPTPCARALCHAVSPRLAVVLFSAWLSANIASLNIPFQMLPQNKN